LPAVEGQAAEGRGLGVTDGEGPTADALSVRRSDPPNPSAVSHPPSAVSLVIPNGRATDVVAFEREVVSFFVEAADLLGVPKSVAAIYGICFASPEPLGFAEIDARLDISTGSISQGLRILREVGALRVSDGPAAGSLVRSPLSVVPRTARPRERYEPDLELRKLAGHWIEERLEKQLKAGSNRLRTLKAAVAAESSAGAKALKQRLKYLQSWHDKSRALLPIMKTFLRI